MVNAISERNLAVSNFAYHLPKAWTRFDHVNGKQPFVNRLSPLSKLYEKKQSVKWLWNFPRKKTHCTQWVEIEGDRFFTASLPLLQVYLYTLIYRDRNTEEKSR